MFGAAVGTTSARIALPPTCFGHIDKRRQDDIRCALRPDTPRSVRVEAFCASD